ncbi:hypothetical protein DL95DRAFT_524672 [Leptodontidium sp. 2 PMI_412]|nr:hypothetical protein DL95DRAFT_524672 [Leptodontidium sp. 2 PMI_412]
MTPLIPGSDQIHIHPGGLDGSIFNLPYLPSTLVEDHSSQPSPNSSLPSLGSEDSPAQQSDDSDHNQVDANVSRPPKRHHCPHCNLKFTYPREVERHKNSLHAAELDSQTRFYCGHTGCKYAPGGTKDGWPRKDNLDRHNRTYQLKLERKKNAGRRRKSPTSGMEDIEP